jgi:HB1, ASXL, restriction endonuclease HTH domain
MSAKKAGKTRAASPPRNATRFPKAEAALRGAPPTAAADDGRSRAEAAPAAATAPEPAPVDAPAAPLAETAAVGDRADDAVAAADRAAAGAAPAEEAGRTPATQEVDKAAEVAPAAAIPAGLALDAPTCDPPAAAADDAALFPAPAETVAEMGRPEDQVGDATTVANVPAVGENAPASAAAEGMGETATLAAPVEGEGVAAAPADVPARTAKGAAPGRRGRGRTLRAPRSGRVDGAARRPSALDAAARVLAEAGRALTCPEMIAAMAARGYWASPAGQTPAATLYSALLREITSKGPQARFRKAGRGQFALAAAV